MATKTLTITTEAYENLAAYKGAKESFSDVVNKLTKRHSLMKLAGILSKKEANELENSIKETRTRFRRRVNSTAKELR